MESKDTTKASENKTEEKGEKQKEFVHPDTGEKILIQKKQDYS